MIADVEARDGAVLALPSVAERVCGAVPEPIAGNAAEPACADAAANDAHRRVFLAGQLTAVRTRVAMLSGRELAFDEESAALYGAVAPTHPESHFQNILEELERALPGQGALVERFDRFRESFVIPTGRLAPVFEAAIDRCRTLTRERIELPQDESFAVEYVTDRPWQAGTAYRAVRSLIQVNTDLPMYIDRAVDLACA